MKIKSGIGFRKYFGVNIVALANIRHQTPNLVSHILLWVQYNAICFHFQYPEMHSLASCFFFNLPSLFCTSKKCIFPWIKQLKKCDNGWQVDIINRHPALARSLFSYAVLCYGWGFNCSFCQQMSRPLVTSHQWSCHSVNLREVSQYTARRRPILWPSPFSLYLVESAISLFTIKNLRIIKLRKARWQIYQPPAMMITVINDKVTACPSVQCPLSTVHYCPYTAVALRAVFITSICT